MTTSKKPRRLIYGVTNSLDPKFYEFHQTEDAAKARAEAGALGERWHPVSVEVRRLSR
jgi:hypothetical protein